VTIGVVIWLLITLRAIHRTNDGFQKQSKNLQLLT
jgi:hypothetical protein